MKILEWKEIENLGNEIDKYSFNIMGYFRLKGSKVACPNLILIDIHPLLRKHKGN